MIVSKYGKPGNKENFNRLVQVASGFTVAGICFQAVSGITEGWGIFKFLSEVFGKSWFVYIIAFLFALVIAVAWERVIRVGVVNVGDTVVKWCTNKLEIKRLEIVSVIIVTLVTIGLIIFSFKVSKKNAYLTFIISAPTFEQNDGGQISSVFNEEAEQGNDFYKEQERATKSRYAKLIAAKRNAFDGEIEILKTHKRNWISRQTNELKFTTKIQRVDSKIAEKKAAKLKEVSNLESLLANELALIQNKKIASVEQTATTKKGKLLELGENEKKRKEQWEQWISSFSVVWSQFAGWSVILASVCILFQVFFKNLTEIETEIETTQEYHDLSFLSELNLWFQVHIMRPVRNEIRSRTNKAQALEKIEDKILDNKTDSLPEKEEQAPAPEPMKGEPIPVRGEQTDKLLREMYGKLIVLEEKFRQTVPIKSKTVCESSDRQFVKKRKTVRRQKSRQTIPFSIKLSEKNGNLLILAGKNKYDNPDKFVDTAKNWYSRQFTSKTEKAKKTNLDKWEKAKTVISELGYNIKSEGHVVSIVKTKSKA